MRLACLFITLVFFILPAHARPIVGGEVVLAPEGEAVVRIEGLAKNKQGTLAAWLCTGTLIHPRVVLTAAHCLRQEDLNIVLITNEGTAEGQTEGSISLTKKTGEFVDRIWFNSNWDERDITRTTDDYGLIVLRSEVKNVNPMRMSIHDSEEALNSALQSQLMYMGYGRGAEGEASGIKRKSTHQVGLDLSVFLGLSGVIVLSPTADIGRVNHGDSGGPLLVQGEFGLSVLGIVSRGNINEASVGDKKRDFFCALNSVKVAQMESVLGFSL